MTAPVSFSRFEPHQSSATLELPRLGPDEAHIWAIDLAAEPGEIARLGDLLADDERQRAARYHFDRHRRRYIVSQGVLRVLLGHYGSLPPAELTFDYGPKGKPSLAGRPELHFNVSHSAERALVAVAFSGPVGVDIERMRDLADADDIARRFFSQREAAEYLNVPSERRRQAFFNCWTRKEAFVKAMGEGLFLSLDRFDVSLAPGEPVELLAIDGSAAPAREWSLADLRPADGFAGALATRWSPGSIRAWHIGTHHLMAGLST